jgi:hypothetical protein
MGHPDATTAYGYDRIVQGMHKGNSGISTGATARSGGRAHLAMSDTKLTACGITVDSSYALIVPRWEMTGEQHADRFITCQKCRRKVGL